MPKTDFGTVYGLGHCPGVSSFAKNQSGHTQSILFAANIASLSRSMGVSTFKAVMTLRAIVGLVNTVIAYFDFGITTSYATPMAFSR
jgi:hypothetical protein